MMKFGIMFFPHQTQGEQAHSNISSAFRIRGPRDLNEADFACLDQRLRAIAGS